MDENSTYKFRVLSVSLLESIGTCRPGHTWALPGLFCILISRGPDTKTRGMLPYPYIYHMCAYTRTDIRIAYSEVTKYAVPRTKIFGGPKFPWHRIKSGMAKSCPGTHTALQAPMLERLVAKHASARNRNVLCTETVNILNHNLNIGWILHSMLCCIFTSQPDGYNT